MKIKVFTREVNENNYPEGLARSVHFEVISDDGIAAPLNRSYGILFAKGAISKDNTIIPKGVQNPLIFNMEDGWIGIAAERVLENGEVDKDALNQKVLWKTKDLIHFEEENLISDDEISKYLPKEYESSDSIKKEFLSKNQIYSDALEVDPEIVKKAEQYWNPIVCTGVTCKDDKSGILISYSDGSSREKKFGPDGRIHQQKFDFPLAKGYGDPVIFPWEGKWYFISTSDNRHDIGIYVREADDVHGLFAEGVTEHLILPFDPERGFEQTFWAPEFHVIGDELYILFAVSGHEWGPQCHMMKKKKGASIIEADSWEDPVKVCKMDGTPIGQGAITLDMTHVKTSKGSYLIWSYRQFIGHPNDTGSMLYIASIDEDKPWILTSEPVLLTRPLLGWENVSGTINNEGPYGFIHEGKLYVTYSGGAANSYTYAVGLLTADDDADLLDISSWTKSITPVLNFYSVKGVFGPGHNSFFTNEDGELMIAYHGETAIDSTLRCDGIRRVHFRADGTPYFQMSAAADLMTYGANQM